METTSSLHAQKVIILGRLIKESSLTLEEALFLLQEEEKQEEPKQIEQNPVPYPLWNPGTAAPYTQHLAGNPYTLHGNIPFTGTTTTAGTGIMLLNTNNSTATTVSDTTTTADLNT